MTETMREIVRLRSGDVAARIAAAEALCRMGAAVPEAAPDLVRACGDEDDQVVEWATSALEEFGVPEPSTLPELMQLVDDPHESISYWAITLIGRMQNAAAPAVPKLASRLALNHPCAVRQRAAWALGRIGRAASPARDALERATSDADPRLARLAAIALNSLAGG